MTLEQQVADLAATNTKLTQEVLATNAQSKVSADAAKADADRALAERQTLTDETTQAKQARDEAVAAAALATSTKIGDEDYVISAVTKLLSGYTDVVDTAISGDEWAEHCHKWGGPRKVVAIAHDYPEVAPGRKEYSKITILDLSRSSFPVYMTLERRKHFWDATQGLKLGFCGSCLIIAPRANENNWSGNGVLVYDFAADELNIGTLEAGGFTVGTVSGWKSLAEPIKHGSGVRSIALPDYMVNDVAARVADDAPVHPVSGVSMPTIAVATDGGVSELVPDGNGGWSVSSWPPDAGIIIAQVAYDGDRLLAFSSAFGAGWDLSKIAPGATLSAGNLIYAYIRNYGGSEALATGDKGGEMVAKGIGGVLVRDSVVQGVGTPQLAIIHENPSAPDEGAVAFVSEGHATPIMPGDVRCALLCDGEEGVVTDSSLVDVTQAIGIYDASVSITASGAVVTAGAASVYGGVSYPVNLTKGQAYTVSLNLDENAGAANLTVIVATGQNGSGTRSLLEDIADLPGIAEVGFVAASDGVNYVSVSAGHGGFDSGETFEFSNVKMARAVADRSGRNNHAKILGTLNFSKSAGSDIAVVSGFDVPNSIEDAENFDSNGDFCITAVFEPDAVDAWESVFSADNAINSDEIRLALTNTGGYNAVFGSTGSALSVTGVLSEGQWAVASMVVRGNTAELWHCGRKLGERDISGLARKIYDHPLRWGKMSTFHGNGDRLKRKLGPCSVLRNAPLPYQIRDMHRQMLGLVKKPSMLTAPLAAIAYDAVRDEHYHIGTDRKLHRLTRGGTTIEETIDVPVGIGDVKSLSVVDGVITVGGSTDVWVHRPAINLAAERARSEPKVRILQLGMGNATDLDYPLPPGWKPLDPFKDGRLLSEGEAADGHPVKFLFDGDIWFLRFSVAPGAFRIAARAQEVKA